MDKRELELEREKMIENLRDALASEHAVNTEDAMFHESGACEVCILLREALHRFVTQGNA